MKTFVVLVRGINVGGKHIVRMADLRRWLKAAGFEHVQTHIQSGNIVLTAGTCEGPAVAEAVNRVIAEEAGFDVPVVVRDAAGFLALVEANPFVARGEDPAHCHVGFATAGAVAALPGDMALYAPDEAAALGGELYLFLPEGVGRSKLAAAVSRQSDPAYTVRNWRTVNTLVEKLSAISDL